MSLDRILVGLCREPISGYELKAVFDQAIRYFWSAELSQIYPTLHRLEAAGLLESNNAPPAKGPRRRLYRTTPTGREKLRQWLEEGPAFRDERYVFAAQVFFLDELGDLDATTAFVRKFKAEFERRHQALTAVEEADTELQTDDRHDLGPDEFHHYLTLRMGIHVVEARIAWCDEALGLIEARKEQQ